MVPHASSGSSTSWPTPTAESADRKGKPPAKHRGFLVQRGCVPFVAPSFSHLYRNMEGSRFCTTVAWSIGIPTLRSNS
jgi:hypothetical protein